MLPFLAGDAKGHGAQQENSGGGAAEDVRGENVTYKRLTEQAVILHQFRCKKKKNRKFQLNVLFKSQLHH